MEFNKETSILKIEGSEFLAEETDTGMTLDVDLQEVYSLTFSIEGFLDDLFIRINSSNGFGTYLFYDLELFKAENKIYLTFRCLQPNKYWNGKYGLNTLLVALSEQIKLSETFSFDQDSLQIEDDWKSIDTYIELTDDFRLSDILDKYAEKLSLLIKQTELILSGAVWKKEYEKDEKLFSTEILYPLLRKMNYVDVRFTHGTREYGKDFTFSDFTKFGNIRNYGMQVKAGNMRGNVNSDIDEIIGQIDDAFSMPYFEISANEERRINTFIIAISGNFTNNAKEKIANKIPSNLKGSVYMLDREKILELIERYWK